MSGNTGTLKATGTIKVPRAPATPSKKSTDSFERTVTIAKELAVGDPPPFGATGTLKAPAPAIPSEESTEKRTVTIVKELVVGDKIEGLDADKQPALCTVEAVGMFGQCELYGNYT